MERFPRDYEDEDIIERTERPTRRKVVATKFSKKGIIAKAIAIIGLIAIPSIDARIFIGIVWLIAESIAAVARHFKNRKLLWALVNQVQNHEVNLDELEPEERAKYEDALRRLGFEIERDYEEDYEEEYRPRRRR